MDQTTIDMLVELLVDLDRAGIEELVPAGDRLRFRPQSAMTPDLAQRVRKHKAALLAVLRPADDHADAGRSPDERGETDSAIDWEDCLDPPEPCPTCGGLEFWWNAAGTPRCEWCDPPATALRILKRAERLRQKRALPTPPGAMEMFSDLKQVRDSIRGRRRDGRPLHGTSGASGTDFLSAA